MTAITQLITLTSDQLDGLILKAITAAKELLIPPLQGVEEKLLSRKAAAKELGISLNTLDSYSLKGIVPAYRLDRQVRFKKSELLKSLQPFNIHLKIKAK